MADKEDIVRRGYQAFGEGDMEHFRAIYTPDVVQRQPGNNQTSGEYKGVDNVLGLYGRLFELSGGTFSVELTSVKTQGDKVVTVHHAKGEPRGQDPRCRRDHRVHVLGRQDLPPRRGVRGPGRRGRLLGLAADCAAGPRATSTPAQIDQIGVSQAIASAYPESARWMAPPRPA